MVWFLVLMELNMTAVARKSSTPKISPEEMERRRRAIQKAAHSSAMEGAKRDPRADPIFESFINGEIEMSDVVPMLKQALGLPR